MEGLLAKDMWWTEKKDKTSKGSWDLLWGVWIIIPGDGTSPISRRSPNLANCQNHLTKWGVKARTLCGSKSALTISQVFSLYSTLVHGRDRSKWLSHCLVLKCRTGGNGRRPLQDPWRCPFHTGFGGPSTWVWVHQGPVGEKGGESMWMSAYWPWCSLFLSHQTVLQRESLLLGTISQLTGRAFF